eukprot:2280273-Pyramimonas_sp.AAC.1
MLSAAAFLFKFIFPPAAAAGGGGFSRPPPSVCSVAVRGVRRGFKRAPRGPKRGPRWHQEGSKARYTKAFRVSCFGALLEPSWGPLGTLEGFGGAQEGPVGPSWGPLGASRRLRRGLKRAPRGPNRARRGHQEGPKARYTKAFR